MALLKRKSTPRPTVKGIEFDDSLDNEYAQQIDRGHKIDPRAQMLFVLGIVLLALFVFGLVCPQNILNEGINNSGINHGYTLSHFVRDLSTNLNGLAALLLGNGDQAQWAASHVFTFLVIIMTGAGMAMSGAVYQGTFKNALVSPSTLGVISGATIGMALWVIFFVDDEAEGTPWATSADPLNPLAHLWDMYGLALCSFIGCIVVVSLVLLSVRIIGGGKQSGMMMIITGQVIGAVMGAVVTSARYFYVETNVDGIKAELLRELQISSFYRAFSWIDLLAVGIPLLVTFAVIMALRQKMSILSFDEAEARTMGVNVKLLRYSIIALCTLTTAIIVSFCGHVGFVGFLIPHLARRLVGPSFKYLVPASMLLGGCFVLTAYLIICITLGPDYKTMTGIFISIGGAIIFLATAISGKGGTRGEFR